MSRELRKVATFGQLLVLIRSRGAEGAPPRGGPGEGEAAAQEASTAFSCWFLPEIPLPSRSNLRAATEAEDAGRNPAGSRPRPCGWARGENRGEEGGDRPDKGADQRGQEGESRSRSGRTGSGAEGGGTRDRSAERAGRAAAERRPSSRPSGPNSPGVDREGAAAGAAAGDPAGRAGSGPRSVAPEGPAWTG